MAKKTSAVASTKTPPPKTLSRRQMYGMISSKGEELILKLWAETESKNPSIRIAALRTLINKVLPDLSEADIKSDGEQVFIPLIKLHEIRRNNSNTEDSQPNQEN